MKLGLLVATSLPSFNSLASRRLAFLGQQQLQRFTQTLRFSLVAFVYHSTRASSLARRDCSPGRRSLTMNLELLSELAFLAGLHEPS